MARVLKAMVLATLAHAALGGMPTCGSVKSSFIAGGCCKAPSSQTIDSSSLLPLCASAGAKLPSRVYISWTDLQDSTVTWSAAGVQHVLATYSMRVAERAVVTDPEILTMNATADPAQNYKAVRSSLVSEGWADLTYVHPIQEFRLDGDMSGYQIDDEGWILGGNLNVNIQYSRHEFEAVAGWNANPMRTKVSVESLDAVNGTTSLFHGAMPIEANAEDIWSLLKALNPEMTPTLKNKYFINWNFLPADASKPWQAASALATDLLGLQYIVVVDTIANRLFGGLLWPAVAMGQQPNVGSSSWMMPLPNKPLVMGMYENMMDAIRDARETMIKSGLQGVVGHVTASTPYCGPENILPSCK